MDPDDHERSSQKDLRKLILEIQKDTTIDFKEKARKIQELMTANWRQQQLAKEVAAKEETTHEHDDLIKDRELSYNNEAKGILGCKHYRRNCKMKAACCGRLLPCRLCHDEIITEHKIDRYATQEMFCMKCNLVQPTAQKCSGCGETMAQYYCDVCKFWDDSPDKKIFHCTECGLCRIGTLGEDVQHCKECSVCFPMERYKNHKHIDKQLHSDCPVCGQYMFTSTLIVTYLPCSHAIHDKCLRKHVNHSYTCPICNKSVGDMGSYWRRLDRVIANFPMPEEFAETTTTILCNDCEKQSTVPFHFYGHKCTECGCYNTRVITHDKMPTADAMLMQRIQQQQAESRQRELLESADGGIPPPAEGEEFEEDDEDDDDFDDLVFREDDDEDEDDLPELSEDSMDTSNTRPHH